MRKGFTLIELVMVIVILGILAAVAMPTFYNLQVDAKTAACKGSLGGLRSGISIWYAKSATGGTPSYPTLADMTATSNGVMAGGNVPANPYNNSTVIVTTTGTVKVTSTGAGWVYSTDAGAIWGATTDSSTY